MKSLQAVLETAQSLLTAHHNSDCKACVMYVLPGAGYPCEGVFEGDEDSASHVQSHLLSLPGGGLRVVT